MRCIAQSQSPVNQQVPRIRSFSTTLSRPVDAVESQQTHSSVPPPSASGPGSLDPNTVSSPRLERKLVREQHVTPIGSRRRRAALRTAREIPFEQLPYQCFQEARKILAADRAEKIAQIEVQRTRLQKAREQVVEPQQQGWKDRRITSLEQHLEELKVLADINDPIVKRIFEDGKGKQSRA